MKKCKFLIKSSYLLKKSLYICIGAFKGRSGAEKLLVREFACKPAKIWARRLRSKNLENSTKSLCTQCIRAFIGIKTI